MTETTYQVFVPTWNRMNSTATTFELPKIKEKAIVVVRPEEYTYYFKRGFQTLALPEKYCGHLGMVRQYLAEYASAEYIWMVDDDLSMDYLYDACEYVTYYAAKEEAGVFGLAPHYMSNVKLDKDGEWSRTGATREAWGVHRRKYLATGLNTMDWPLCEDLYTFIGMQVAGYKALFNNVYTLKGGDAPRGGCQDQRSQELVREMVVKLHETYPKYVSLHKTDKATEQRYFIGFKSRVSWAKIHKDIPRK